MWLFAVAKQSHLSLIAVLGIATLLTLVARLSYAPDLYRPTSALPATGEQIFGEQAQQGLHQHAETPEREMRPGTFVYLVMGPLIPDRVWRDLAKEPNVYVIFLAWKEISDKRPNATQYYLRVVDSITQKFGVRMYHYPHSSWAAGRNKMLQLAMRQEEEQGWRYEYVIFLDDDVRLLYRPDTTNESVVRNHDVADRQLRASILQDRPARASVENSVYYLYYPLACVRNCAFDAAVDVFHRSIVEYYLPYPTQFDRTNWWMSSETMSYRSAILAPRFCNLYRHVVVDAHANAHRAYPKGILTTFQDQAIDTFLTCLNRIEYSEIESDAIELLQKLRKYGLKRPFPNQVTEKCSKNQAGVDYTQLMKHELESWPSECI
eukprot:scpid71727/ scgid19430/ 